MSLRILDFNDSFTTSVSPTSAQTTTFAMADNQGVTDVTGLSFNSTTDVGGIVEGWVIKDATVDLQEFFRIKTVFDGSIWHLFQDVEFDDSGADFSIDTGTGQVQYATTGPTAGHVSTNFYYQKNAFTV